MRKLRWVDLTGNLHLDDEDLSHGEGRIHPVSVPPPPSRSEGLAILVEDGAIFPVSPLPFTDLEARQKEQADTHAEALALAAAREARSGTNNGLMKFAAILTLFAAAGLAIVIMIVALQARFGDDSGPAVTVGPNKVNASIYEEPPAWL